MVAPACALRDCLSCRTVIFYSYGSISSFYVICVFNKLKTSLLQSCSCILLTLFVDKEVDIRKYLSRGTWNTQNFGGLKVLKLRLLKRTRVIFVTYRPLEVKGHPDGRALGDGVGVSAEDLGERGAVCARRLRVDDVLRVLETHAEKYLAVLGLADTAGAAEGVDLQLEDPGGEGLRGAEEWGREGSNTE